MTASGLRRQDQLLTTAIALIARHGVEGTTFARIRAAVEIVTHTRHWEGEQADDRGIVLLAQLFTMGQAAGEMREFDPVVMAVSLRAAVDAAALRLVEGMTLDARSYGEQFADLFDAAVAT